MSGLSFEEIVVRLGNLPRPVIIHFAQVNHIQGGKTNNSIDDSSHSADSSFAPQHGDVLSSSSPSSSYQEPVLLENCSDSIEVIEPFIIVLKL